ncbi:MAG: leucine-rich repeat domain-containing protein [Tannerella sp.]|jgi:hypothetical protein|nr:leucine-rich repeat domain-containing protein [Tannerella sp.]
MKKFTLFTLVVCVFSINAKTQESTPPVLIGDLYYTLNEENMTAETAAIPPVGEEQPRYTLTTITVPSTVTCGENTYNVVKIGNGSLRDLPNVTSITIPESVQTIGNSAFASCPNLITVVGSANASLIEDWAFYGCGKLTFFLFSPDLTAISEHCFQECASLTSLNIPVGVTTIGTCAFQNCANLRNVSIPTTVSAINSWSFYGTGIESITIPEGVQRLAGWTFGNCSALKTLKLPASLTYMEDWVFDNVSTLEEIYVDWATPPDPNDPEAVIKDVKWWTFGDKVYRNACIVKVPAQYRDAYGDTWFDFPVESYITGLSTIASEQARVYYANGTLNLFNLDGYTANVISVSGQHAATFKINKTGVQLSLAPGIYILNATKGKAIVTTKFIVK